MYFSQPDVVIPTDIQWLTQKSRPPIENSEGVGMGGGVLRESHYFSYLRNKSIW